MEHLSESTLLAPLLFDPGCWDNLGMPSLPFQSTSGATNSFGTSSSGGADEEGKAKGKRQRKKPPAAASSSVQAADLERQYLAKLEAVKQLTAAHQDLKDKAWVLDQVNAAHEDLAARLAEVQSGQLQSDPFHLLGLSVQEVLAATPQEVLSLLKGLQLRTATELLKSEQAGVPSAELLKLGEGMLQSCKYAGVIRPDFVLYYSLHVDSLVDESSFSSTADAMPRPPQDHWRRVVEAGKIPPLSLTRCAILAQLTQGWMDRVQAEREVLTAALKGLSSNTSGGMARYLHPASSGQGAGQQGAFSSAPLGTPLVGAGVVGLPAAAPEEGIVNRLQANMDKERNIVMLVGEIMYTRIFSPIETCRLFVHSHPWIPDDFMLLKELANLHQEAKAAAAASAGATA